MKNTSKNSKKWKFETTYLWLYIKLIVIVLFVMSFLQKANGAAKYWVAVKTLRELVLKSLIHYCRLIYNNFRLTLNKYKINNMFSCNQGNNFA